MRAWLRSIANAFLGKVPGKTGRTDTATRMWLDARVSEEGASQVRPSLSPQANRTAQDVERALKAERHPNRELLHRPSPKPDPLDELRRLINRN